jgi:hypothetical protein
MDESGGPTAVEVDRALGPELDHHLGELDHRQASVDVRATTVAGDRHDRLLRDPECGARVATLGDVGVELPCPGREALAILSAVEDDDPAGDE